MRRRRRAGSRRSCRRSPCCRAPPSPGPADRSAIPAPGRGSPPGSSRRARTDSPRSGSSGPPGRCVAWSQPSRHLASVGATHTSTPCEYRRGRRGGSLIARFTLRCFRRPRVGGHGAQSTPTREQDWESHAHHLSERAVPGGVRTGSAHEVQKPRASRLPGQTHNHQPRLRKDSAEHDLASINRDHTQTQSRRRDSNPEPPDYKADAIRLVWPLPATPFTAPPPPRV
jgi:hypothetical protein